MFSFFRKSNDNIEVPEWASFFLGKEYKKFISIIDKYFTKIGVNYIIDDGIINPSDDISATDENSIYQNLGLSNISQLCNQLPRRKWKKALNEHSVLAKSSERDFAVNQNQVGYIFFCHFLALPQKVTKKV